MKLHYYPETDSLYIDLANRPSTDSREISDGLVVDFDAKGNVVGIDIDHASEKLDLKTLETDSLPARHLKKAASKARRRPTPRVPRRARTG
jgi:uncharacterized protein YuzE